MQEIRSINFKTKNLNDMIEKIKQGLPAETAVKLSASLDLPLKAIAQIADIAESTLARRRKKKGKLKADESDRIVRIARLRDRTVDVFEDDQQANRWLKTPLRALGGHSPLEYAESELGAQEVLNLLGRIEHGVFS
jgi:putative toxin-antitoxin system antitoxin component (TIGR02293 family)